MYFFCLFLSDVADASVSSFYFNRQKEVTYFVTHSTAMQQVEHTSSRFKVEDRS